MATLSDPTDAIEAIRRAQRVFQTGALRKLHPDLEGEELVRAVAREAMRDQSYTSSMELRLREGFRRVTMDPTLSAEEKQDKLRALLRLERRYLEQHIEAASWRILREAELSRLKRQGEREAFWLMDEGKRTHTADCLAMEGKAWPMDVLARVNPANRHPGCGCRLISLREAERRGYRIRRGGRVPAEALAEAGGEYVDVPVRPGEVQRVRGYWRRGKNGKPVRVSSYTRHMRIWAPVPPEMERDLGAYLDAVSKGDLGRMDTLMSDLVDQARDLEDLDERDQTLRSLSRIHATAVNPRGTRAPTGQRIRAERRSAQPVPRGVPEAGGLSDPWGDDGTFQWMLESTQAEQIADRLRRTGVFDLEPVEGIGYHVRTREQLSAPVARSRARALEIMIPELRRQRVVSSDEALGDDTPLDIANDEIEQEWEPQGEARYRNVTTEQLGDAAESVVAGVAERLRELRLVDDASWEWPSTHNETGNAPLDWIIGNEVGVEAKSEAWRGFVPHVAPESAKSIDPKDRASKQAAVDANDLRPVYMQIVTDLDNDVAHVFWREYAEDEDAFKSKRIPEALKSALVDGTITPGDMAIPERGPSAGNPDHATVFVGTFRLGYNPLAAPEPGERLPRTELRARAQRGATAVDVGPRATEKARIVPVPQRRATTTRTERAEERQERRESKQERDDRIVDMAVNRNMSQSDIARELGVSQPTVHRILVRRLGKEGLKQLGGRGARRDLGPDRARGDESTTEAIKRLAEEGLTPPQIAKRLKVTRGYVARVLGL